MSFGKTMEILAQVANVLVAFVQSEFFVSAHDTKTTDMSGRDSGNVYIMSNQAKGVHFNWIAERGPASDRLYSYASSEHSFKSTVEAMKGLGNGHYVQIVFQPVGTVGGAKVRCGNGKSVACCSIKTDIYASVGTSKSGYWNTKELLKGKDTIGQNCNCATICSD